MERPEHRRTLQETLLFSRHGASSSGQGGGDRFIPCRSAMDFGYAHAMLTDGSKEKAASPYRQLLAEALLQKRTRILAFKPKPSEPMDFYHHIRADHAPPHQPRPAKQRRYVPRSEDRALDAPGLVNDFYLNLLDWGSSNVVAIALGNAVYLWHAADGSASALMTVDEDSGPVTSVSWAPDGQRIALGLNSSDVQLWDTSSKELLRTLRGAHRARVGSLSWRNDHLLTTGCGEGLVVNNDVRARSHIAHNYRGHSGEICGLKWSGNRQLLASGGNDDLLHIWDLSVASHNAPGRNQWLHRLEDHKAAVRALAWCPFQSNLLASGGGTNDRCIKFWNTQNGACLNSVDTGSQVCGLLWSKTEKELLSSHGFLQNQLTLWKYPAMVKMAELEGHTSRVLFVAQSPDGCTVASADGDETLMLWNVFGTPERPKRASTANPGPFANSIYGHIR